VSLASETESALWRVNEWFPKIGQAKLDQLAAYHKELIKLGKTNGLVSPKTVPFADVIHFADSILASTIIKDDLKNPCDVYDLGSGSGFPGLVFSILFSDFKVFLVETDASKCEFLSHIGSLLSLKNATVLNIQAEKIAANQMKHCMARGYASISKTILGLRKSVIFGGAVYHIKSNNWASEVGEMPTQLCSVWTPALVGEYRLPVGSDKFAVVKTSKIV
jgi:16S rRNA (guanine527-N7)-methyltransferase